MTIKCPNCGKTIFDGDKCSYCKFELKEKDHNFEPTIYKFLYKDYLISKNKAATIKKGVAEFNKSMSEIKQIVDFIADEAYEKGNYRTREELELDPGAVQKVSSKKRFKGLSLLLLVLSIISGIFVVKVATISNNKSLTLIATVIFLVFWASFARSLIPGKISKLLTIKYKE